jgi:serine/threonine protein kinase
MPHILQMGEIEVEVPDSFANYDIVRQIGIGGFSAVVLARDRSNGMDYACKIVTRESLTESGTFGRFEQEVRLLEQLRHPNIVPIVDCFFEGNFIFVVMEYCSGGELFQYLVDHGRMRECECRRVFGDIVSAISYIHARGIVHRDIKPENILLDDSLGAKLGDLGLCKLVTAGKLMTTPCGSPIYAAPEVIGGQGYDGKQSDVWSLGVVLYVMATASPPWHYPGGPELFKEVLRADYKLPMYLSVELKALIRSLMNVVATERPTIEEVANHPWLTAVERDELGSLVVRRGRSMDLARGPPMYADVARRIVIVRPVALVPLSSGGRGHGVEGSLDSLLRKVPPSAKSRAQQQQQPATKA